MSTDPTTITVFISAIWQGLLKGHGLVTLHKSGLRLELQVVDSLTGLLKVKHFLFDAALCDIASVSMRSYLWGFYNVLLLQGTRMDVFSGFPRARGGRCKLRVARRDRVGCAEFVQRFELVKNFGPQPTLPGSA